MTPQNPSNYIIHHDPFPTHLYIYRYKHSATNDIPLACQRSHRVYPDLPLVLVHVCSLVLWSGQGVRDTGTGTEGDVWISSCNKKG